LKYCKSLLFQLTFFAAAAAEAAAAMLRLFSKEVFSEFPESRRGGGSVEAVGLRDEARQAGGGAGRDLAHQPAMVGWGWKLSPQASIKLSQGTYKYFDLI
jgi:hypothetical protein